MARLKRIIKPGALVHMISNFVNGEFLIRGPFERATYLILLGKALAESGWSLIGYALMSSHIHLALVAGSRPFEMLARRIHPAFSRRLNCHQNRRGPVLSDRPNTFTIDIRRAPRLLAYLHNNPVKAGICDLASDSTWTSHRTYTKQEPAPSWLNVDLGLQLCGFETNTSGRADFNSFVQKYSDEDEGWLIGRYELAAHRRQARLALGSTVKLAYPHLRSEGSKSVYPVLIEEGVPLHPRWRGPMMQLLTYVARNTGITVSQIQSRDRSRDIVRARRIVLLLARHELGRGLGETADQLGITPAAGLKLLRTADKKSRDDARQLAESFGESKKVNTVPKHVFLVRK